MQLKRIESAHSVVFVFLFLLVSCRQENRSFESIVANACRNSVDTFSVNISSLPFDWDEMYFFSSTFPFSEIENVIDVNLPIEDAPGAYCCFLKDRSLIHFEAWYVVDLYSDTGLFLPLSDTSSIWLDYLNDNNQKGYLHVERENPTIFVKQGSSHTARHKCISLLDRKHVE